jgi:hypothetical protein
MPRARFVLLALSIGCAVAWGKPDALAAQGENKLPADVREILEKAEGMTLLSLDPDEKAGVDAAVQFHGWKVLGETRIKDRAARAKVAAALVEGASKKGLEPAKCFNPRHGLQLTHKGKTVDLVICFKCARVRVYGAGAERFLISRSPQPALDKILKDAGVPLPVN